MTERTRLILCNILSVANWLTIVFALGLVFLAAFVKMYVEGFTNLVADYDGDTFTVLLILFGIITIVVSAGGAWIFKIAEDPDRRSSMQKMLLGYMAALSLCACLFLVAGIMCYTHANHIEDSFQSGFTDAMESYSKNAVVKFETDQMQMDFRCCGNLKYSDWFFIQWIDPRFRHPRSYRMEDKLVKKGSVQVHTIKYDYKYNNYDSWR